MQHKRFREETVGRKETNVTLTGPALGTAAKFFCYAQEKLRPVDYEAFVVRALPLV
jgi:hypothetical protein